MEEITTKVSRQDDVVRIEILVVMGNLIVTF